MAKDGKRPRDVVPPPPPPEKVLTRGEILDAADRDVVRVPVPEWGGTVYVRTLSGRERDAFEEASLRRKGDDVDLNLQNLRARLVAMTACDETGKPLFTEKDIAALGEKSGVALTRVYMAARKLNALTAEDQKELAGNLDGGPGAASASD